MVGFQAEQRHEESYRKVFTFGKAYRKANNIDRMQMLNCDRNLTRQSHPQEAERAGNRHSEYRSRCCCPPLGPPSGFPAVSPVIPVT